MLNALRFLFRIECFDVGKVFVNMRIVGKLLYRSIIEGLEIIHSSHCDNDPELKIRLNLMQQNSCAVVYSTTLFFYVPQRTPRTAPSIMCPAFFRAWEDHSTQSKPVLKQIFNTPGRTYKCQGTPRSNHW